MTSTDLSIGIAHGKDTVSDLICSKGIHQGFFDFDTYSTVVFACESKPRQHHHPTWHISIPLFVSISHVPVTKCVTAGSQPVKGTQL